jgi:hypothetical protein
LSKNKDCSGELRIAKPLFGFFYLVAQREEIFHSLLKIETACIKSLKVTPSHVTFP